MKRKQFTSGDLLMRGKYIKTPTSSFVRGVQYVKRTQELLIQFAKSTYAYADVHPLTARGLVKTKSVGSYWHRNIKGKFISQRFDSVVIQ